jgi:sigma-E factor negative regulatory protein RseA
MTEKLRQSLSAAMDDEADAFELRRVLDELNRDPELRGAWERYHLIGSVMRGEHRAVRPGLRERVWQALDGSTDAIQQFEQEFEQEFEPAGVPPADLAPERQPAVAVNRRRIRPYAGLAAAAAVAMAVVFGTGVMGPDAEGPVPTLAGADLPGLAAVAAGGPAVAASDGAGGFIPETEATRTLTGPDIPASDLQRAHAYMLHHTQQQAMNQSSVMSLVKLATYEAP